MSDSFPSTPEVDTQLPYRPLSPMLTLNPTAPGNADRLSGNVRQGQGVSIPM